MISGCGTRIGRRGSLRWDAGWNPLARRSPSTSRAASRAHRGDGGALCYVFDTPGGRLFYQDTSGYWTGMVQGIRPDVAIIAAAGRGNIDGEPIQGSLAQFVGREAALLRPGGLS